MVSAKTMESIREVTISLMEAQTSQWQGHVHKVLEKHGVDPSSMPELNWKMLLHFYSGCMIPQN